MSATKTSATRKSEKASSDLSHPVRLEELETRMLLARLLVSIPFDGVEAQSEPPLAGDVEGSIGFISREVIVPSAETSGGVEESPTQPAPTQDTSDASDYDKPKTSSTSETKPTVTVTRPPVVVVEPEPTDTAADETKDPSPPVRQIDREPTEDKETIDKPTPKPVGPVASTDANRTSDESQTGDSDRPGTNDRPASCEPETTERKPKAECKNAPLALEGEPPGSTDDGQEASRAGEDGSTMLRQADIALDQAPVQPMPPIESASLRTESGTANASDPLSATALPDAVLGDLLTGGLAADGLDGANHDAGYQAVAASVLAVAFTKPLSRFNLTTGGLVDDTVAPVTIPIAAKRRRRKDSRRSTDQTEEELDDLEGTHGLRPNPRGREHVHATDATLSLSEMGAASDHYLPYDVAIIALLDSSRDDSSEGSAAPPSIFASARSYAAGALAAAAAWFTLQGSRRVERNKVQLRPATPEYVGPTVLAAN